VKYCYAVIIGLFLCSFVQADDGYVGAALCGSCHTQELKQWQKSHHFSSMQLASPEYVKGDFSEVLLNFHNIKTRLYKKGEQFFVDTLNGEGKPETFLIKYTFGFDPLQQYLIELDGGHIQALNVAWDSRSKEEGGQRWFHLRPDEKITAEHPFYWTRYFQNWNGRCADCHSTNVQKNYDQEKNTFKTTWSEINVACESCHGPGATHIDFVKNKKYSPLKTGFEARKPKLTWVIEKGHATAKPKGEKNHQEINTCGACHSLRTQLIEKSHSKSSQDAVAKKIDFHDANFLQLPVSPVYFADGQIREEAFVMGSFMQSKMYDKGVTCGNCHNPHSNEVLIEGNGLCTQCHDTRVFDTKKHHHHPEASAGAQCVNCHMPARTYMQVDDRRDHSFKIPRPDLSRDLDVPNVCTGCHQDKGDDWSVEKLRSWGVSATQQHWAYDLAGAGGGNASHVARVYQAMSDHNLAALTKASLLSSLAPSPSKASIQIAIQSLQSDDPILRRSAVTILEGAPPHLRWQLLSLYLDDPSRSVRHEVARVSAPLYGQLPPKDQSLLKALLMEYRSSLEVAADSPGAQLNLAQLNAQTGKPKLAEQALKRALVIEPSFVPALINLADYYRQQGFDQKAEPLLKRALGVAPKDAGVHHSYGLYLIRQKRHIEALPFLRSAVQLENTTPRYAYVYAIALDSVGNTKEAVVVLDRSNARWPMQYDTMILLLSYLEKSGSVERVRSILAELKKLAPNSPDVKHLSQKYK